MIFSTTNRETVDSLLLRRYLEEMKQKSLLVVQAIQEATKRPDITSTVLKNLFNKHFVNSHGVMLCSGNMIKFNAFCYVPC